ncbi:MAG: ABC transporter ATP-binding protein [Opitutaceae bacterium]|jgi:ATP-binding cassette subfamily B protein
MKIYGRILSFFRPYWLCAIVAPLLMMGEVALDLLQPRLVRRIIDEGIGRNDLSVVYTTVVWMSVALVIAGLCGWGCGYFAVRGAYGMGADLRRTVFGKVQTLCFGNLDKMESGSLITRMTSDVNQVQEMAMMMLRGMVRMPLLIIGSLVMAVLTSPKLGVVFFAVLPALVVALVIIVRKTFPLYQTVQRRLDALYTVLQENLAGVRLVKAFAREDHERKRFSKANENFISQMTDAARMSARTTPIMTFILNIGIITALWVGGRHVACGHMRVGEVVAFISYLMQALASLMVFSNLIIQVSRAQASARRVNELMESKPTLEEPSVSKTASQSGGRVEFQNVTFGYAPNGCDPVLKNVNFVAEPGQTLAILGATGSGKSTLVQLIPRFYDATSGSVTIDGVDVRDIPEEELRRQVSIALQEPILFSTSVSENISFGEPDAGPKRVEQAALDAQADDFVRNLPHGYDTRLGQRGVNLSGGQKQRLAIARALLPRARVLILDDSTSAVDVRTERLINDALSERLPRQTRIVVAQRISTVLDADKILVLDDGVIAGEGTHEELLGSCEIYRGIYDSQVENGTLAHHVG